MTMKLERTLLQWANMNPKAIASCSAAAVTFLAADAQKDIASLATELASQRSLTEALEAENARLRGKIEEALRCLDGEPEYHDQGMGCGLEDRGITDRYDAMAHGWEQAMERVYSENIAWAKDALSTPSHVAEATDSRPHRASDKG